MHCVKCRGGHADEGAGVVLAGAALFFAGCAESHRVLCLLLQHELGPVAADVCVRTGCSYSGP